MSAPLVIAVDPATVTGLAWTSAETGTVASTSVRLVPEKVLRKLDLRFFDPRPVQLRRRLVEIVESYSFSVCLSNFRPMKILVAFEDVQFAKSLAQVQLWGTLRGAIWTAFDEIPVEQACFHFVSCPTGVLKRFATGSGNADKDHMAIAARRRWPDYSFADDNEVDARLLWHWAVTTYPNKQ